jgi:hypothetical protein
MENDMKQEIIEALKSNEKPFVLLPAEQQAAIMEANKNDGLMCLQDGIKEEWSNVVVDWNFGVNWNNSYRLRPDYQLESEIVDKYDMLRLVDIITTIQAADEQDCLCDHDRSFVCDRCECRIELAEQLLVLFRRSK